MRTLSLSILVAALAADTMGCGDDTATPGCTVGATQACLCAGGFTGVQTCTDGGTRWSDCDCGAADADADVDGEADSEPEAAPDEGIGGDADAGDCSGSWRDPTTGYLWESPPDDRTKDWDSAMSYCDALTLCGLPAGSWHLPTISELRSLVRGCPTSETGGACGLTDTCTRDSCWSSACDGCSSMGGPGSGGCYWDPEVAGPCPATPYWSSSTREGGAPRAADVRFDEAYVYDNAMTMLFYARCVRTEP